MKNCTKQTEKIEPQTNWGANDELSVLSGFSNLASLKRDSLELIMTRNKGSAPPG